MGTLEGRYDALQQTEGFERRKRFVIGDGDIDCPSCFFEQSVLRPYTGVVEAGRYGVSLLDLTVIVLQDKGFGSVQHTHRAFG